MFRAEFGKTYCATKDLKPSDFGSITGIAISDQNRYIYFELNQQLNIYHAIAQVFLQLTRLPFRSSHSSDPSCFEIEN